MRAPEQPRCLHAWLADTARRMPNRPAVDDLRRRLTIGDLHEQARALAGSLVRVGVSPGSRVAVVADKSADAITAIFATLMAGGIYVPMPSSWPPDRVETTLARCGATAIISAGGEGHRPTILSRLTNESIEWGRAVGPAPPRDLPASDDPSGPALLLFTSGSTGVPKGVTLSHQAVGAFVSWAGEAFGLGPDDRLLCPSPLNFDLSTLDVFSIAVRGTSCVVMPEANLWMPRLVTRFAREAGATVWYSVPSILMQMLDEGHFEREPIASLRTVLFAGEVMPPAYASRLREAYPAAQLWNLYGPTETNVVTAHRLGDRVDASAPVPIGRACPYATLRLDPSTVEIKDGQRVGELLVAGATVMTGYWGLQAETERALVRAEDQGGAAFYRTGDRVAEGPDGTLSFVGRVDRQVKRRGVRIELGEIEAALASAPGVAEAAAVASGEVGTTIISAFVAAREGAEVDAGALRLHCARLLPSYMMPDEIQKLGHLPRGSRGKVDYESLRRLSRRSG